MSLRYLMRAKDSITAAVFTWLAASPDFAAVSYPGPNSATNTMVQASYVDGAGAGAIPSNPADDGKVVYAQAGGYSLAPTVKIVNSGASLSFGSSPATAGTVRFSNNSSVRGRNAANSLDASLLDWSPSNVLALGQGTVVAHMRSDIATSGTFFWGINNVDVATLSATALSLALGGTAATSGSMRVAHGFNLLARNNANSGNPNVISFGAGTTDQVKVGDSTVASMRLDVATGGSITLNVNAVAEYDFSSVGLNMTDNTLRFGTNPATSGAIRLPNTTSGAIMFRNNANTNNVLGMQLTAADDLQIGTIGGVSPASMRLDVATGGAITLYVNANAEYSFSATAANFTDNALQFGTNPATAGLIRVPHASDAINGRNNANGANIALFRWGVDGTDMLTIGESTLANLSCRIATAGQVEFRVNGTVEYYWTAAAFGLGTGNVIILGDTNVSTLGMIRTQTNVTIIGSRNAANSANASIVDWSSGDLLTIGDGTVVNGVIYGTRTGTPHTWQINAVSQGNLSAAGLRLDTASGGSAAAARLDIRSAADETQIRAQLFGGQTAIPFKIFASDGTSNHFTITVGGSIAMRGDAATTIFKDSSAVIGTGNLLTITGQDFTGSGAGTHTAGATTLRGGDATGATATHVGGLLTLRGGDATGGSGTRTGGGLDVRAGTGATANGELRLLDNTTPRIRINATGLAFFNTAPVAKPTVSGAKGSNAALGSLMTALSGLGLVTDSTSA